MNFSIVFVKIALVKHMLKFLIYHNTYNQKTNPSQIFKISHLTINNLKLGNFDNFGLNNNAQKLIINKIPIKSNPFRWEILNVNRKIMPKMFIQI